MAETILNVAVEIFKCLLGPIRRQSGYLRNYSSNLEKLKKGVEKLMDERESMQKKVVAARNNGDEIEKRVEKWLINADKEIDEAEKLIKEEGEANKKCFIELCPNLKKRYQLSKKALIVEKAVVGFKEEAEKFEQISHRTVPEEAWLTSVKVYEAFDSRISTLTQVQNALSDSDISIVGVHGIGGVGKTTLVKEVARQGQQDKLFEVVVFTEVSQAADTKKIQCEIAEKLGLELREETESVRASRLCERLKKEKKVLVILDNMWKHLDLETVGIPYGDDHKGCKVLLTARDRNVLSSMGSKVNFSIGVLNEEEAWRLFKKMADDDVERRELKSTAVDVAKACGGLPIAITTIARALRNKTVPQWKKALRELRKPSSKSFEGVPAEAYSTIELSYKYLKNEQLKKTFLLCSLMSNHAVSLDLFKCGMGLAIFQGQGVDTMEDARIELYALVQELKDCCLLLEGDSSEEFSMHDVVRDVAISIAHRDEHAFVVRNEEVWKWPDKDTLGKCTAISIIDSSIRELPEGLECPQLQFLFMKSQNSSVEIPENFFPGMRKLRVVDLTGMQLMSLPSSVDLLTSLQTLCLDDCELQDVAIIGKLKNLEILSFRGSNIVRLPKELGQLTKLRFLDLDRCFQLKVIAPCVISSLTRLEELYMSNCSVEWGVEGPNSERRNATLDELMHLPHLSALKIDITSENILPEGLLSKKLSRYRISIGNGFWYWHQCSKMLCLELNSTKICLENLQVVKDVEYLRLDKLQGVENVLLKLDANGFTQLKYLYVQNNPEFLCIVDSMERMPCDAFPLLESLTLSHLINLEQICRDELRAESFNELKSIIVSSCGKLTNIFSFSTSMCLPRLQKITVIGCDNMEEIFDIRGENDANNNQVFDKVEFAQLTTLKLRELPQLTCFYKAVKPQENLITSTSTQLFSEKVALPNLDYLELYKINVESIWHNDLPATSSSCFRSLTKLLVSECHKLRYIFSSSMVKSFEQLQHLDISNCMAVEEIIAREEGAEAATSFVFPRVTTLIIRELPELRCFNPGMNTLEWPVLENLEVYSCDKVKTFASEFVSFNKESQPLFLVEKVFINLKKLTVSRNDIAMIWQNEFPEHLFGTLKFLEVENYESPGFALVLLERFRNLEELKLVRSSCKEIFSNGQVEIHVGKLAKIKNLTLSELHELNHLWEQNSKTDSIFQSLEVLVVTECKNLTTLCPSSASFQHLTELTVWRCHKLMNLMTSTAAKSLVQLVNMTVWGCNGMTEVVVVEAASEGDAARDNIIFSKLKTLDLWNLKSLTSFCSGNCTFEFSCLKFLKVNNSPMMKNFSGGKVITPRVKVEYDRRSKGLRDGDLNTTIQQLYQQKLLEERSIDSTVNA